MHGGALRPALALMALLIAVGADEGEKLQKPYDEGSAREYNAVRAKLKELLKAPDLGAKHVDELKAMGEEFARRWRSEEVELYGRTTLYLVQKLGSHNFHDKRADAIGHELAFLALERADLMPLDVHCGLAFRLQRGVDASGNSLLGTAAWPGARRRIAECWLRAWQRLERAIDPNWDPEDRPCATVFMPEVGRSGVSPRSIQDPELRKRYEAAIAENEKKKEAYGRQAGVRRLAESFPRWFERSLMHAYLNEPRDLDELQRLLDAHVTDAAARERVVSSVRRGR